MRRKPESWAGRGAGAVGSAEPSVVPAMAPPVVASTTEQAAQKAALAGAFDIHRLRRVWLRRISARRRLPRLLLGIVKLALRLGELPNLAQVEEDAAATGALIDRHPEPLNRQHLRYTPRTQQRRLSRPDGSALVFHFDFYPIGSWDSIQLCVHLHV